MPTISSRTPEGLPHRCAVCGKACVLEPSLPGGDSCCPWCGHLLWWFRDHLPRRAGISPELVTLASSFATDLQMDSLDIVELMLELEAETGIDIADEDLTNIETVEDAIRFIEERRSQREDR